MSKTTTTRAAAVSIALRYLATDGASRRSTFKTLKGAQAFAHKWVGATPEIGSTYAVSGDGVGRITWEGCTAADLFPATVDPVPPAPAKPYQEDQDADDDERRYAEPMQSAPAPAVPDLPAGKAARKASRKPGKVKTTKPAGRSAVCLAGLRSLAPWVPAYELAVMTESREFDDIIVEQAQTIADMPTSYSTTDQGEDAVVVLHYFNASSDWWLTEKDAEGDGRRQCFGFARINGDSQNAELGYCDVSELVENGVELDLHWIPVRIGNVMASHGPASIRMHDDGAPPAAVALDPEAAEIAQTIDRGLRLAHAADADRQAGPAVVAPIPGAEQGEPSLKMTPEEQAEQDADDLDDAPAAPRDDGPVESLPPQQSITLPVRKLQAAAAIAATKDVRYYLCTVMLHQPDDKGARIVSTDGFRLLVQAADLPKPADWMNDEGVLLSAADLREALPMLNKHGELVTIEWERGHSHATLRSADGFAALRVAIVEGKYPDYQRILQGVDLSNKGGDVADSARINPDFLKGAASVASMLGSKGVQAFAGSSTSSATFLFDGEADAVMVIMPMRTEGAPSLVTAKVAGLVGGGALASSVAALRAHLTRTTSAIKRAAAEGGDRAKLEERRISLEGRIADMLALCGNALPAPKA